MNLQSSHMQHQDGFLMFAGLLLKALKSHSISGLCCALTMLGFSRDCQAVQSLGQRQKALQPDHKSAPLC